MEIYVIHWRHYDGSDSGLVRCAFDHRPDAERWLEILNEHGGRVYTIEALELRRV